MANVLGELFQDIADAIRSKTGSTDTLKPNQFPSAIEGITTGGGGSSADERVKYVTFVYEENGETKEYSYPVIKGDTCHDPAALGLINPTKASTVQYNYTFYGWGASDGGAADSTILRNVTSDKTVYAIYTATVRYYTITWLDDDGVTVLKTEQVAYGAVPSYAAVKDGAVLDGWTPSPVAVTGDASYTASWIEAIAGNCGTDANFSITSDRVMRIIGTGAITSYTASSLPPWSDYTDSFDTVIIEEGITSFNAYAFSGLANIKEIVIPNTVTTITQGSLSGCSNLERLTVPFSGQSATSGTKYPLGFIFGTTSFDGSTAIATNYTNSSGSIYSYTCYVPDSLQYVAVNGGNATYVAFQYLENITEILFNGTSLSLAQKKLTGLKKLTIGENVKTIYHSDLPSSWTNFNAAVFDVTEGWTLYSRFDDNVGTDIPTSTLSSSYSAAKYLKSAPGYSMKRT